MPETVPTAKLTNVKPDSLSNFESFRETIESVAVAFMLAFIFKTFLVEAFVIPTGSMAPTLQGKHQDITCPQCGFQYRAGARDERPLSSPICPNCEYQLTAEENKAQPVYMGDRILVNKFLYDFDTPQRWDVIVFKFPEDSKTNYIKRLIGLPGEQLSIRNGDIYTTKLNNGEPTGTDEIARKPNHKKLLAMLQEVYANDNLHEGFVKRGWPLRWKDTSASSQAPVWMPENGARDFTITAATTADAWLRYEHFVPSQKDWVFYSTQENVPFGEVFSSLIVDDYAYNSRDMRQPNDWVGDIAVEAQITTTGEGGSITLELVKGGKTFRTVLNLGDGSAKLLIPELPNYDPQPTATAIKGPGTHQVLFANVDRQLTLLVDGQPVFDPASTGYEDLQNYSPVTLFPPTRGNAPCDNSPAGIAVNGTPATVKHLRILRDVYYINHEEHRRSPLGYSEQHSLQGPIRLLDDPTNDDLDQFLMLGDNSPASSDSRYWSKQNFVQRRQLIGKAIYVFWPHAWSFSWSFTVPLGPLAFDFPFYPNFKRMTLIR